MQGSQAFIFLIAAAVGLVLLFVPPLIASTRKHPQATPIFLTTVLLGWTGLFWVLALIWSCSAIAPPQTKTAE
jgi:ABC-type enterobactin transport system permease subunit